MYEEPLACRGTSARVAGKGNQDQNQNPQEQEQDVYFFLWFFKKDFFGFLEKLDI
jgi:hypothetical protein